MTEYHQMEPAKSSAKLVPRILGALALGLVAAVFLAASLSKQPQGPAASGGWASVLAASVGLRSKAAVRLCNCPPSEAIWQCTEDQYRAVMNGTTCSYYAKRTDACASCEKGAVSSECRACALSMSTQDFCSACRQQGLNDVGCRGCLEATAGAEGLLGHDVDRHGCQPFAGYRWCETSATCLRPWEHGLRTQDEFAFKCSKPGLAIVNVGQDVDEHGCRGSAGYRWCAAAAACVRPWERGIHSRQAFAASCGTPMLRAVPPSTPMVGGDRDEHGCIPSAGYQWCKALSACIRPWEHGIHSLADLQAVCKP